MKYYPLLSFWFFAWYGFQPEDGVKHSEADISHSLCPECMKQHYPKEFMEIFLEKNRKKAEQTDALDKK